MLVPTQKLKNKVDKGYKDMAGVFQAIKNSDLNKTTRDIRTLSISKNKTIKSIKNKDYDADKMLRKKEP